MDRKEFLKQGVCCGAALLGGCVQVTSQEKPANPAASACDRRVKQGQDVIRRLVRQLDDKLDRTTRESIMEGCGRACYEGAHGKRPEGKPGPAEAAKFLEGMRKYVGPDGIKQTAGETTVFFRYTGNPQGLKTSDGYCLCPILEDAPKDISPTYCHCSVGYVREIFERGLGKPCRVEVTETVLRGDSNCRFTVTFSA